MNVALFGASGYIGGYLLRELIDKNYHPIIQLRHGSESKIHVDKGRIHSFYGEIDDLRSIRKVLENANAVIYNIGIIREYKKKGITFESLHFEGLKSKIHPVEPKCDIVSCLGRGPPTEATGLGSVLAL